MDERYQLVTGISVEDYQSLRAEVCWAKLPDEQARRGIHSAFRTVSVTREGQTVGMARLLWDGGYCAYLSEVAVSFDHRHQGLAGEMIRFLLDELKAELRPGWQVKVHLLSARGKEGFYEQFGFQSRPNERLGAGMDMWLEG